MKKHARFFALSLVVTLIASILCTSLAVFTQAADSRSVSDLVQKELKIWYDEPAPDDDNRATTYSSTKYSGWEVWALPLGNGYAGSKVFGLTERERIQINENTLSTSGSTRNSGTTNFTETYVHFNHTYSGVSNYSRDLILNDATSHVSYVYEGVTYTREYFASYPDGVIVLKFDATGDKNLSFTLEPKIPYYNYEYKYGYTYDGTEHEPADVTAEKLADGGALITLEGYLPGINDNGDGTFTTGYGMYFEAQYKVVTDGTLTVANPGGTVDSFDEYSNGTVTVTDANTAYVVIALGTNYELDPQVFTATNNLDKLDGFAHPHEKVSAVIAAASEKSYDELRAAHVADYKKLFDRVALDFDTEVPTVTTDVLLKNYKSGSADLYVDEMLFAYGRYLQIASSRAGGMPSNLNGIWNRYHCAVCMNGYWHNINTQMNYWATFNTNLAECFSAYLGYYTAYSVADHESSVNRLVGSGFVKNKSDVVGKVWSVATGLTPFTVYASSGGRDGWGNTPLMAEVFWSYYAYTGDKEILKDTVFPAILASANFMTYVMKATDDGLYLAQNSGSPEQSTTNPYLDYVYEHPGYVPQGTAYDQTLTYSNYLHVLEALEILGLSDEELDGEPLYVVNRIREQVDKLDPISVGYSGQVKEFREEFYYGEIGETAHRHISQLCALVQGSSITDSETPAWFDAAEVTMLNRGSTAHAWADVMRASAWTRLGNGDEAYDDLRHLINNNLGTNMLTLLTGIFQAEANLATPSVIAEMLLQSHEGFIAPLAALPSEWKSGAYSGLVAYGGFEVGAAWTDGFADEFTVYSKNGGSVSIKYINVAKATVKDSAGNKVSFTSSGTDLITFETVKGETYTVTNIPDGEYTERPADLTVSYGADAANLTWTASSDAKTYNVYRAAGSEAEYTLIASGVATTSYAIEHTDFDPSKQYTYAVSAVSADGRESARAHLTVIPLATPNEAHAYLSDGEMTVYYDAVIGDGVKYRLYEKTASGTEILLKETENTCAVVEGASANGTYYIKTLLNGFESTVSTAVTVTELADKDTNNLFLNKEIFIIQGYTYTIDGVEYTSGAHTVLTSQGYVLSKAVDGDTSRNSRFAMSDANYLLPLTVMIDIGRKSELDTLKITPFYVYGPALKIDVSTDGESWTEAKYIYNSSWQRYGSVITVELQGAVARYIRITFNAKGEESYSGGTLYKNVTSIVEMTCSGTLLKEEYVSKLALQNEIDKCLAADISKYSSETQSSFNAKLAAAVSVLESELSGKTDIDKATSELAQIRESVKKSDQLMPDSASGNYGNLTFELDTVGTGKYEDNSLKTVPGWWNSNFAAQSVTAKVKNNGDNKYLAFRHEADASAMTATPYWDYLTSEWFNNRESRENIVLSAGKYDYAVFDIDFTTYSYTYTLNGTVAMGTEVPEGATDVKLAYPDGAWLYENVRTYNEAGTASAAYQIVELMYDNGMWYVVNTGNRASKAALKTELGEWNHLTTVFAVDHENLGKSKLLVYVNGALLASKTVGGTPVESYMGSFRVDFNYNKNCGSSPFELAFDNLATNYYGNGDGTYSGGIAELVRGERTLKWCSDAVYDRDYVNPDGSCNKDIVGRGYTLSLEGEVFINKYMAFELPTKLTKEYIEENGKVLIFTEKNAPLNATDAVYGKESYIASLEYSGISSGYEEYRAVTAGIPAKELGDVIYFRPYVVIDGEYFYGELESYSVLAYCEDRLEKSSDAELKDTLRALLNYGAAIQTYFGYKTDRLVNAGLSESERTLAWDNSYLDPAATPDGDMTVNFAQTDTLADNGNTLVLEGAVSVKYYIGVGNDASKFEGRVATFYFWTEADYNALKTAGTPLSKENASYTVAAELVYSGSAYGYEFTAKSRQFVAKELGSTLYSTLTVTDSEGTEHCSGVSAYSPETYAYQKINDGTDAPIDVLVKWLTVYGECAKKYFAGRV